MKKIILIKKNVFLKIDFSYKIMFNYFNRKIDPIFIEKMNNNELTVEDILDQEEIISDFITNPNTIFNPFFSNEVIRKLIDYSTKMPSLKEYKTGHKFPYNANQILLSENKDILDRIFNQIKIYDDDSEIEENENDEENYIDKKMMNKKIKIKKEKRIKMKI